MNRWEVEKIIPQINPQATGNNIRRLMNSHGMSVKDVQFALGFATPQSVYKWFRGNSLPSVDNLVILADLLGCTVDSILVVEK